MLSGQLGLQFDELGYCVLIHPHEKQRRIGGQSVDLPLLCLDAGGDALSGSRDLRQTSHWPHLGKLGRDVGHLGRFVRDCSFGCEQRRFQLGLLLKHELLLLVDIIGLMFDRKLCQRIRGLNVFFAAFFLLVPEEATAFSLV